MRKPWNKDHQERRDKLPKDMRPAMLLAKGVDSTATPVPGLPTSACAYCDSYQQRARGRVLRWLWEIGTVRLVTVMQEATSHGK